MDIIFSRCRNICTCLVLFVLIIISWPPWAAVAETNLPQVLKPWTDWVLHGQKEKIQCIPRFNDGDKLTCTWPTRLYLQLSPVGGEFTQSWEISHENWITLPGSPKYWPQSVLVDDIPALVMERNKSPMIKLPSGHHTVTGEFSWKKQPDYLQVPPKTALLSLFLNNTKIAHPNLDESGRLWLKKIRPDKKKENHLKIETFRRIDDAIPPRVTVFTTLDISGTPREITLGPIYQPSSFVPLSLECDLPAKLEQNGTMRIQVKPGRYTFNLVLRHLTHLSSLSFERPRKGLWPDQEIWSFVRRSDLRIVEIKGVSPIDPTQTSLPESWQKYPAFRVLPGEVMVFKEIKRGDPLPAPDQLILNRTLWLRFDGSGYTVQDHISGKKNTGWRLEMSQDMLPGRISVDGKEQLITVKQGAERPGVELRKGILDLTADSTFRDGISTLPATGWNHDFQQVMGKLHLPPGWKLIHARGIDNIPHTWIKKWTLLDFFIVLMFTIAGAKIFSIPLALTGFLTLVLTWHEPFAPRYVWPALLVGAAFLKHLPSGKFKQLMKTYQCITITILIFIAIPYAIHALRTGLYPQLKRPWISMNTFFQHESTYSGTHRPVALQEAPETMADSVGGYAGRGKKMARKAKNSLISTFKSSPESSFRHKVMQYDPKAMTQTGPGLPLWKPFQTIDFSWSGPVSADQTMDFILIGPTAGLILSFVRVTLIILLALGIAGAAYRKGIGIIWPSLKSMLTLCMLLSTFTLFFNLQSPCYAEEIPSGQMLDELRQRLLEKDDCFPACADISTFHVKITPEALTLSMEVEAQIDTIIPLPGHVRHWVPSQVKLDEFPAKALFRMEETLWAMVPAGKHHITCEGKIRQQNTLQLPLPLKPHKGKVDALGWEAQGLNENGVPEDQLQFKRLITKNLREREILATGVLPPFARVERTLLLGLVWKVETVVYREGPAGTAMTLDIPLLPGESVSTQGVRVQNGQIKVTMNANQKSFRWDAFLEPSDTLPLKHMETTHWTEVWTLDVSPIFHVDTLGIPVILHQNKNRWHPTWHPWPGETVTLKISRPAGIQGQTLTMEKTLLTLHPGRRSTNAKLALSIKSSQGGQHTITLPEKAELHEVIINGKTQLIRQENRKVPLPITPGNQEIVLKWSEPGGMRTFYKTPSIDLGSTSVNAATDLHLPSGRWPLFLGGEQLAGPAVLFWSVVIIVIIVSAGLSMTGLTPLKFFHWVLLGLGMSMSNSAACLIVVAWLLVLDMRTKTETLKKSTFNLVQMGIAGLTLLAGASLVFAISQGLIGHPDMNITGNGSTGNLLRWYHDVSVDLLPRAWVISIPMWAYRITMLLWALWISLGLVKIVKWAWHQYTQPVIWHDIPRKKRDKKRAETTALTSEKE